MAPGCLLGSAAARRRSSDCPPIRCLSCCFDLILGHSTAESAPILFFWDEPRVGPRAFCQTLLTRNEKIGSASSGLHTALLFRGFCGSAILKPCPRIHSSTASSSWVFLCFRRLSSMRSISRRVCAVRPKIKTMYSHWLSAWWIWSRRWTTPLPAPTYCLPLFLDSGGSRIWTRAPGACSGADGSGP